ncbi:hypothetical protein [Winogradskyella ursingii]|uniref:hypothetical protein n=1 Tax=Winogradskyella ursingii TaxID=2686079 RepID=UPI0015CA724C|nr:hypothetical protein [Winogradskyella ursingii]
MNSLFLPLVNWGLGTIIIGVFAVVCIVLVAVIYNLTRSNQNIKNESNEDPENDTIINR